MAAGDEKVGGGFVELSLDQKQFETATKKAAGVFESSLEGMGRNAANFASNVLSTLTGVSLGIAGLVKSVGDAAGDSSFSRFADVFASLGVDVKKQLAIVEDFQDEFSRKINLSSADARAGAIAGGRIGRTGPSLLTFLEQAAVLGTRAPDRSFGDVAQDLATILRQGPGSAAAAGRFGIFADPSARPEAITQQVLAVIALQTKRFEAKTRDPGARASRAKTNVGDLVKAIGEAILEFGFGDLPPGDLGVFEGIPPPATRESLKRAGFENRSLARRIRSLSQARERSLGEVGSVGQGADELSRGMTGQEIRDRGGIINEFNRFRTGSDGDTGFGKFPGEPMDAIPDSGPAGSSDSIGSRPLMLDSTTRSLLDHARKTGKIVDQDDAAIRLEQLMELKKINDGLGIGDSHPLPVVGFGS